MNPIDRAFERTSAVRLKQIRGATLERAGNANPGLEVFSDVGLGHGFPLAAAGAVFSATS